MSRIPHQPMSAQQQQTMGVQLVEQLELIVTRNGGQAHLHSVPLLAGVLFGQAMRYGWTLGELGAYALKAFQQMATDLAARTGQAPLRDQAKG